MTTQCMKFSYFLTLDTARLNFQIIS